MTKLNLYPSLNKSGFGEEQRTEPKFTMVSRKSWTTVLAVVVDVTIWIAVSLAGLVLAYNLTGLEPVTRGFFCDDQTIQYPYRPDSVKDSVVVIVSILIPAVVIFLIETARAVTHRESLGKTERSKFWSLIISLYRVIGIFLAGGSGTILVTEVLKLVSGRLRPHYFDVCQANFTKINCSLGYITPPADFCMNTDTKMLLDARKSFPSGHASLSAYGAMFLLIFLQRRFIWRHFKLIPPLIQMFIFSAGIYISISRVTDNKHHATDVIGGGIIGVVIAVFMVQCVWDVSLSDRQTEDQILDLSYRATHVTNGPSSPDVYTTAELKQRGHMGIRGGADVNHV